MDPTLLILAGGGAIIALVIALQFRPIRPRKGREPEHDGPYDASAGGD